MYISDTNKKIDGFCQRSDSSPGTCYSTTRGDIDFCGDQTSSDNSAAKMFARRRAKSRGKNEFENLCDTFQ